MNEKVDELKINLQRELNKYIIKRDEIINSDKYTEKIKNNMIVYLDQQINYYKARLLNIKKENENKNESKNENSSGATKQDNEKSKKKTNGGFKKKRKKKSERKIKKKRKRSKMRKKKTRKKRKKRKTRKGGKKRKRKTRRKKAGYYMGDDIECWNKEPWSPCKDEHLLHSYENRKVLNIDSVKTMIDGKKYMYVMECRKQVGRRPLIYILMDEDNGNHPCVLFDQPAEAAGIIIKMGNAIKVDACSGHYLPKHEMTLPKVAQYLLDEGIIDTTKGSFRKEISEGCGDKDINKDYEEMFYLNRAIFEEKVPEAPSAAAPSASVVPEIEMVPGQESKSNAEEKGPEIEILDE